MKTKALELAIASASADMSPDVILQRADKYLDWLLTEYSATANIDELPIKPAYVNMLRKNGIETVVQFAKLTPTRLAQLNGSGTASVRTLLPLLQSIRVQKSKANER